MFTKNLLDKPSQIYSEILRYFIFLENNYAFLKDLAESELHCFAERRNFIP